MIRAYILILFNANARVIPTFEMQKRITHSISITMKKCRTV